MLNEFKEDKCRFLRVDFSPSLGFRDLIWSLGDLTGFNSYNASELYEEIVYKSTVGNMKQ